MGLVKTRRLASMHKQQRAKSAMKPPMKGAFRSIPEKAGKGGARRFALATPKAPAMPCFWRQIAG